VGALKSYPLTRAVSDGGLERVAEMGYRAGTRTAVSLFALPRLVRFGNKRPVTALNCDRPNALLELIHTLLDAKQPSWISPLWLRCNASPLI
jgi:hypothetical protein